MTVKAENSVLWYDDEQQEHSSNLSTAHDLLADNTDEIFYCHDCGTEVTVIQEFEDDPASLYVAHFDENSPCFGDFVPSDEDESDEDESDEDESDEYEYESDEDEEIEIDEDEYTEETK